jgi:hypothetical protein
MFQKKFTIVIEIQKSLRGVKRRRNLIRYRGSSREYRGRVLGTVIHFVLVVVFVLVLDT